MDLRTAQDEALGKAVETRKRQPFQVWKLVIRSSDALLLAIYSTGFAISLTGIHASGSERVWLELPGLLSRKFGVDFRHSIIGTTVVAGILLFAAAILRTWAEESAHSGNPHEGRPSLTAAEIRISRVRPCLGNLLHMIALSLLLTWQAAIGTLVATLALEVLLFWALQRRTLTFPQQKSSGAAGWVSAAVREVYFWGAALSLAALGSTYNASRIMQGLLISLGVSIVARGVMRGG